MLEPYSSPVEKGVWGGDFLRRFFRCAVAWGPNQVGGWEVEVAGRTSRWCPKPLRRSILRPIGARARCSLGAQIGGGIGQRKARQTGARPPFPALESPPFRSSLPPFLADVRPMFDRLPTSRARLAFLVLRNARTPEQQAAADRLLQAELERDSAFRARQRALAVTGSLPAGRVFLAWARADALPPLRIRL